MVRSYLWRAACVQYKCLHPHTLHIVYVLLYYTSWLLTQYNKNVFPLNVHVSVRDASGGPVLPFLELEMWVVTQLMSVGDYWEYLRFNDVKIWYGDRETKIWKYNWNFNFEKCLLYLTHPKLEILGDIAPTSVRKEVSPEVIHQLIVTGHLLRLRPVGLYQPDVRHRTFQHPEEDDGVREEW